MNPRIRMRPRLRLAARSLLAPLLLLAVGAMWAAPPLTTLRDTIYKADGSLFNGIVIVEWRSFDASDQSFIGKNKIQANVVDGVLNLRLVPTTTASSGAYYSVKYVAGGNVQFSEFWAVPAASSAVRVLDVRIADPLLGPLQTGEATTIEIDDIAGLRDELDARPSQGPGYQSSRAAVINGSGELEGATGAPDDCIRVNGTSGPCGTGGGSSGSFIPVAGTFIDGETPAGAINGSNLSFALSQTPNPASSLLLYRNGILQKSGLDYTLTGNALVFSAVSAPQPGDQILASFRTAGAGSTLPQVICTAAGTSTTATTATSLGTCAIPANLLRPGDRLELSFDVAHSGSAAGFQYQVLWGSTTILNQSAGSAVGLATGRSQLGFHSAGEQWSTLTWGNGLAIVGAAGTAGENRANSITVDFRGNLATPSTDSLALRNFSVVRYPAP